MINKNHQYHIDIDSKSIQKEYFKDLLRYRMLFYFFALRDILVRYKQTFLGVAWSIIRPLINLAVFALVFGKIANLGAGQEHYYLFVLAGLLPWQLFASCIVDTSHCLANNSQMISKIYFPRIILPVSTILVNCVDFAIGLVLLLILICFVVGPHWALLALPFVIGLTLLLCTGMSLLISAATVRYRDLRFIVPFIVQFGMFISPVGYSSFLISEKWRWIYFLNPMAGVIESFRYCCLGVYHPDLPFELLLSTAVTFCLLIAGFYSFRKMERVIADII